MLGRLSASKNGPVVTIQAAKALLKTVVPGGVVGLALELAHDRYQFLVFYSHFKDKML